MSIDAHSDHKKYKELTHGYVQRQKLNFPSACKEDHLIIVYNSFEEFVKKYPTSENRDECLAFLEDVDGAIKRVLSEKKWQEFVNEKPSFLRRILIKLGFSA